jgi:hypothetical protein
VMNDPIPVLMVILRVIGLAGAYQAGPQFDVPVRVGVSMSA